MLSPRRLVKKRQNYLVSDLMISVGVFPMIFFRDFVI
jgi:hypothetical protein